MPKHPPERAPDDWVSLAERMDGARLVPGGLAWPDAVQVWTGDWIVALDRYATDRGTHTRGRAPFANPDGFRFELLPVGFSAAFERLVGPAGVPDPSMLDGRYLLESNALERASELFDDADVERLLVALPPLHLAVREREPSMATGALPHGIEELYCECHGRPMELEELESLVGLFGACLPLLAYGRRVIDDDVDLHLRRLLAPGGVVDRRTVRWDGDAPRRDAAEALGRLADPRTIEALASVLDDDDPALRILAIAALGRIRDPAATRALLPMLVDPVVVHDTPLAERLASAVRALGEVGLPVPQEESSDVEEVSASEHAATALRALGQGALVDAFHLALEGDPSSLGQTAAEHRDAVIEALLAALESPAGAGAAAALAELRAVEALPALRGYRAWLSPRDPTRLAIDEAIRSMAALGSLPRAVQGAETEPSTLPRTAGRTEAASESLPRPADDSG